MKYGAENSYLLGPLGALPLALLLFLKNPFAQRFLTRYGLKVSIPNADKDRNGQHEVRTRNQFSLCEKHEVAKYLVENPNMLAKDIALFFSEKFNKPLTADTVRRIKSEGNSFFIFL